MGKHLTAIFLSLSMMLCASLVQAQQTRVLWWDGSPSYGTGSGPPERKVLAQYLKGYDGGRAYDVTYHNSTTSGDLGQHLNATRYDILVLDLTTKARSMNASDLAGIKAHYQSGKRALMLDGTLYIRNLGGRARTKFPGENGNSAALLINQIDAVKNAGGGIIIGTDHNEYQAAANQVLQALVPGAKFKGLTKPSSDGAFFGDVLLNTSVPVRPLDVLRHWEAVPSQAEAPVGPFTDFMGNPVTLFALVETADQPGGGRKRPYISSTIDPGDRKRAIDDDVIAEPEIDRMPTRKSPSQ